MRFIKILFSKIFICVSIIAAVFAAIIFLCVYIRSLLPAAVAIALFHTVSAAAAYLLLASPLPHEFKCSWLTLIVLVPPIGGCLFLLSGAGRRRSEYTRPVASSYETMEYFDSGAEYLERLLLLISSAEKCVLLEYYIISDGAIWKRIYPLLMRSLECGVEVMIICDGWGSGFNPPKRDFIKLKRAGAKIAPFNGPHPFPLRRLNCRNHRKLAVADGRTAMLGGVNIADEYAGITMPHGYWKDGGIAVCGEVAAQLCTEFLMTFSAITKTPPHTPNAPAATPHTKKSALPVADSPEAGGSFEDTLCEKIYSAKGCVHIFTPYICAGEKLLSALKYAAAGNADVKIIIPGVPDKRLTYAVTKAYAAKLSDFGVRVFVFTPGFMHFKGVVCDDEAFVGSYNLDYRSLKSNLENGLWCGEELAALMERDFENTLALCRELLPARKSGIGGIMDNVLFLLAPLM